MRRLVMQGRERKALSKRARDKREEWKRGDDPRQLLLPFMKE